MKRMVIIAAICALLTAGGCGSHGVLVARVVTSSPDDGTHSYEMVYEDGKVKKTTSSRRKRIPFIRRISLIFRGLSKIIKSRSR